MIGVIDSKICNIFSLTNMLKKLGASYMVIDENFKENFNNFDRLILPGVGAFNTGMENLKKYNFLDKIVSFANSGRYILGICLGMQLLFEESEEFGIYKGIGLISGRVVRIKTDMVLPHMGWNDVKILKDSPLVKGVRDQADFYFVHSYRVDTEERYIVAITEYGEKIPAIVNKDNVFGTQFHPEKSKKWGEIVLKNFIDLK
ncbi:MAG TPA: imidazole glycerol phosphate synthase subunit HisH [Spirochaetota bacterium]|nr:imidazole glycerol phosphate synthase subunit HisH [Spirochaetota bacterium]HOL57204.1 imidazole glycerol phosphate synthase subunit HisH [Spirochaetota bacterium]HPP04841.1 imidazole glycerol phosphate synthase subunit HisH [Spirochaetota bacterium]